MAGFFIRQWLAKERVKQAMGKTQQYPCPYCQPARGQKIKAKGKLAGF